MLWWSSSIYSSSGEKSQSAFIDDMNIAGDQCDRSVEQLQFSLLPMWRRHKYLLLKYLFIDSHKDSSIAGLQYLLEYYMFVLFMKAQFSI